MSGEYSEHGSKKMPVVFVGHGSPENALGNNDFARGWEKAAAVLTRPKAILCISGHWYTDGMRVCSSRHPKQIFDMYGFSPELSNIDYKPEGSPELAARVKELLPGVRDDEKWGIDHGAWSVLCRMFPKADIPVVQLSVDRRQGAAEHFEVGRRLAPLRGEGVLILCSGDVVHDIGKVDWEMDGGFPWAIEFDAWVKERILSGRFDEVVRSYKEAPHAKRAVPTKDHYYPLLCALGAGAGSEAAVFNKACTLGSISMTSYVLG